VYTNAHYIWYAYAGVGLVSFAMLVVYILVTRRIDARRAAAKQE
jgi:heme exporter protein D